MVKCPLIVQWVVTSICSGGIVLFNDAINYSVGYMLKDKTNNERRNLLPLFHELLLPIRHKRSVLRQYSIYHSLCPTD